jgi:uncharacterized protein (DUF2141 family)
MRAIAPLLIALATTTAAYAQSDAAWIEFQPMTESMPDLLIAPDPLSGTLLKPLVQRAAPVPTDGGAAIEATPAAVEAAEPEPETAEDAASAAAVTAQAATAATEEGEEGEPEQAPQAFAPTPEPAAAPAAPSDGTVTVIVEGVDTSQGLVNVALCDKDLSEEGCPHTQEVRAAQGFVEARFEDIPPGVYAVVGYHDVNGNNEFDKFLGMPREPYALSNRAGQKMVPTFRDAALKINAGENTVIMRLQRLLGC